MVMGRKHTWFFGTWEKKKKTKKARQDLSWVKILQIWISAEVNLCKPGASLHWPCNPVVGATRRGCWGGWNKAEVIADG